MNVVFFCLPDQVAQLQSLLKPHMLRRMKKDVPDLDIPDKRELVVPIELSREQKEVYRAILTKNMDVLRKVCTACSFRFSRKYNKQAFSGVYPPRLFCVLVVCRQGRCPGSGFDFFFALPGGFKKMHALNSTPGRVQDHGHVLCLSAFPSRARTRALGFSALSSVSASAVTNCIASSATMCFFASPCLTSPRLA